MSDPIPEELSTIYRQRFTGQEAYRGKIWDILTTWFEKNCLNGAKDVLDLGCGYGEFINQVYAGRKYAMDLNPDAPRYLSAEVEFIRQDCSQPWQVGETSLDVIFTSNFFEHLPDKVALGRTLDQAHQALKPGGLLIAIGPNIKLIPGSYWDFWDHYIPLTDSSLGEALENRAFQIKRKDPAFLPYTMAGKKPVPLPLITLYLAMPWSWRFLGKQFLLISARA